MGLKAFTIFFKALQSEFKKVLDPVLLPVIIFCESLGTKGMIEARDF